jgi:hypothetical protein
MIQHSDHPTLSDYLARSSSLKRKAEQIVNCEPPYIYGVHGDWGAGKTSYLKQLRCHLDGSESDCKGQFNPLLVKSHYKEDVITIWFDAWRYQHEAVPVIALIQEIRKQFGTWAKANRQTKKLLDVTVSSVLNGFDDFAKFLSLEASPISIKTIQTAGDSWEKDHLEQRLGIDKQHQFLEEAVDSILSTFLPRGKKRRLIVFIDDLDRCSPEAAYRLLEGLKVYLSLKNTVFVIGMNQQIIEEAIAINLPQELLDHQQGHRFAALRMRAAAYLEKLCGNIERLAPPSSPSGILEKWLEPPQLKQQVALALADAANVQCLPPNPRRLKALANLMNQWYPDYASSLNGNETQAALTLDMQSMLFLAYSYQFHGDLFQRLHYTPAFFSEIIKWVNGLIPTSDLPDYFGALELPQRALPSSSSSATPGTTFTSNYPNPYSSKMFWIAPLLIEASLQETHVTPIMQAICK